MYIRQFKTDFKKIFKSKIKYNILKTLLATGVLREMWFVPSSVNWSFSVTVWVRIFMGSTFVGSSDWIRWSQDPAWDHHQHVFIFNISMCSSLYFKSTGTSVYLSNTIILMTVDRNSFSDRTILISNFQMLWSNVSFQMISLGLQCYGAEDDRTFGIPGEVTYHFFLIWTGYF